MQAIRRRSPNVFAEDVFAKQQHDERHHKGDCNGIGQRKVLQGGEHGANPEDVKDCSKEGQFQNPSVHAPDQFCGPDHWNKNDSLNREAHEQQLAQRYGLS